MWWLEFGTTWNGSSLFPPHSPSLTCYSDASGKWGCGAILSTSPQPWFQLQWPDSWTSTNIAAKEMTFCQTTQLTPLPLSECTLCLFVAHLTQQSLQPSSICTYLSSLRHLQISAGLLNPFTPDVFPRLTYILRGIKRSAPSHPDKRLPITPEILRLIWQRWSSPPISYETRLLLGLLLVSSRRGIYCQICPRLPYQYRSTGRHPASQRVSSRIHPNTPSPL